MGKAAHTRTFCDGRERSQHCGVVALHAHAAEELVKPSRGLAADVEEGKGAGARVRAMGAKGVERARRGRTTSQPCRLSGRAGLALAQSGR